ncbi:hypothetical protein [Paraburkholderia phytofirmans]|uniref:hypothetical protein n=1 Tax=Paraburkholderia phytofirmans TaxID=261302 RepID=UPI0011DF2B85|nr:hypothetical protein [Paraburkholderia phytofirmans]
MRFALLAFSAGEGDCCLFACGAMGRKEGLLRAISGFCLSGGGLGFFAFGELGLFCLFGVCFSVYLRRWSFLAFLPVRRFLFVRLWFCAFP